MKALSVHQPWAWFMFYLPRDILKDIENRNWYTNYRGPLAIHASGKMLDYEYDYARRFFLKRFPDRTAELPPKEIPCGGVLGIIDLIDIVEQSDSKWFEGPYGWVLRNPRPLPFTAIKGHQSLFDIPNPEGLKSYGCAGH